MLLAKPGDAKEPAAGWTMINWRGFYGVLGPEGETENGPCWRVTLPGYPALVGIQGEGDGQLRQGGQELKLAILLGLF